MAKKITLTIKHNVYRVKSTLNTLEVTVGHTLKESEVQAFIDRNDVDVIINK